MEYIQQDPEEDLEGSLLVMEPYGTKKFQVDADLARRIAELDPGRHWDIRWGKYKPEIADAENPGGGVSPQLCLRLLHCEDLPPRPACLRERVDPVIKAALSLQKVQRSRKRRTPDHGRGRMRKKEREAENSGGLSRRRHRIHGPG